MASDTKAVIEQAIRRVLDEVPALDPLRLVIALELRGGRDVQHYRVELPGPKITKDPPADAKVRLELARSHFNELAAKGTIRHWREAFELGHAKAYGPDQILKLIANVAGKQEERDRTRRARAH